MECHLELHVQAAGMEINHEREASVYGDVRVADAFELPFMVVALVVTHSYSGRSDARGAVRASGAAAPGVAGDA